MSKWFGRFDHGDVVRFKPSHPFHKEGWGVILEKLELNVAGVLFPDRKDCVAGNVADLELQEKPD